MKRTHYAGVLRTEHIDQRVTVMGWVHKRRNLGGLIFVDLRDREGIVQVVFDPDVDQTAYEAAEKLRSEFVIGVTGEVKKRQSVNPQLPTGQIEIFAQALVIFSEAQIPPIHINDEDGAGEGLRLKYRYLDLRKPKMQANLIFRNNLTKAVRDFFNREGFIDVETPFLNKPTPEGARDYLVPSRVNPGHFYALPQSPQIFKQLLMVSGMDRYYQITKCFRDEDLRADRQPEFTQIDVEMSFVDTEDILKINEAMLQEVFKKTMDVDLKIPFPRIDYAEAMERFGSDKPDLRFGFELKVLDQLAGNSGFKVFSETVAGGGTVRGINIKGHARDFSRKDIASLEEYAKTVGAKGLAWMKFAQGEITSPIGKFFEEEEILAIRAIFEVEDDDLILFVADTREVALTALGALRVEVAKRLDLLDAGELNFLWVTEFPLVEYDEQERRYVAKHHPFTMPREEDIALLDTDLARVRAKAYDIVLNGVEIGGGSIRIHDAALQKRMFQVLGLGEEEVKEKFGFLIEAFKYGTPPHGGIAYGLDRMVMLMRGAGSIREVIAFPKTQNAACLMSGAPGLADKKNLEELSLQMVKEAGNGTNRTSD
ncbi:MAG: aspartate--tRNA ligase [delta proteobacterium ML8_F1]|nr:MAG: aspartate--tRNA ligase [delta proteobacterium ML8_F1]